MASTATARTPFGIGRQLRLLAPVVITWALAAAVLALAGGQQRIELKQLFLDASYLGRQPWYTGILNEAGLISWSVAATAAALGGWIAHRGGRHGAARFLIGGAIVVSAMLIDVWIQFHSAVAPRLGIPSNVAQVAIAALGLGWALMFLGEIKRTRWLVLLCSFAFLGGSAGIDTVFEPAGALGLMLEDGARLIGILTLTHYLVVTTVDILRSLVQQAPPTPLGGTAQATATSPQEPAPATIPRPRSVAQDVSKTQTR